jgi:hypothetical protein
MLIAPTMGNLKSDDGTVLAYERTRPRSREPRSDINARP